MNSQTTKKVTLALGVASVAASVGNVSVKAGPALQTLNNLTNTADFTINNTYGQSFSVDGKITLPTVGGAGSQQTVLRPFEAGTAGGMALFTAGQATLTTGFDGSAFGGGFQAVTAIRASVAAATGITPPIKLRTTNGVTGAAFASLNQITLTATGGTQTVGASISSTIFGPSNVKGSSSFTNQLINDLSAF